MRRWTLCLLLTLTGCATGPWSKTVTSFSNSAPPDLAKVSAAYTTVGDVHTLEEQAQLVDHYSKEGFHPGGFTPFMSDAELRARTSAISELQQYVTLLGGITSGKDVSAALTGKAKTTTTQSTAKVTGTLNQQELTSAFTGLNAVMERYIAHKVSRELPALVQAADPSVQTICSLLGTDMGDLRIQAKTDYQELMVQEDLFIQQHTNLGPVEERAEILKLAQLEIDATKTDDALAAAQAATQQIAQAHHRLASTTGASHDTK
jgi:hypothetical protein